MVMSVKVSEYSRSLLFRRDNKDSKDSQYGWFIAEGTDKYDINNLTVKGETTFYPIPLLDTERFVPLIREGLGEW